MSDTNLIERLYRRGAEIGEQAARGNASARHVVRMYKMWDACPGDGMAKVLVEAAFQEWEDSRMSAPPESPR